MTSSGLTAAVRPGLVLRVIGSGGCPGSLFVYNQVQKFVVWTAAPGVGKPVNSYCRNIQSHAHVQGSGIRRDKHPAAVDPEHGPPDRVFQKDKRSAAAVCCNFF